MTGTDLDPFLASALATDSPVMPLARLDAWLDELRRRRRLVVTPVPFDRLDQWRFDGQPRHLSHVSGRFFTIEGFRVETSFGPVAGWDQPIIVQPEIGILGLVARDFDGIRHFLLQAKMEPGNVNGIQLSPTEQATRSNYTRVHGGNRPTYNAFFTEAAPGTVLLDRLLIEQGGRFLRKRNRNMVVAPVGDIPVADGFCWLTLGQIKRVLASRPDLVNMTTRSIISCLPPPHPGRPPPVIAGLSGFGAALVASAHAGDRAVHDDGEILDWLTGLRAAHTLRLEPRPLDQLDGWIAGPGEIRRRDGRHFAVEAVEVQAVGREVTRWSQPLLNHSGRGLTGFLVTRLNGVPHFLTQACLMPGNAQMFDLGPTVSGPDLLDQWDDPASPALARLFRSPPAAAIRFDAMQSEEGGRFRNYRSRYMVVETDSKPDFPPDRFRWLTLEQLGVFNHHGHVNIEARNLLACLDFSDCTQ